MSPDQATPRVTTGIEGLDSILRGGLPRGSVYLLKGSPGVGKTTLALHFVLAGVALGETTLYITLSETEAELREVARSHGWTLAGIEIFELNADRPVDEATYTMYHPSEVELQGSMAAILEAVDRVNPSRVVLDSLSEVRLLAQDPLRYRRQILALKRHFVGKKCTVLLLGDHSAETDNHLESVAHGVLALERRAPIYGSVRRRMEIVKLRGVKFRDGWHDYAIGHGGITLYPRLVASQYGFSGEPLRVASGVKELDDLLGGGLDGGTATLVIGPAGSGKSALASHYAAAVAKAGQRAAIFIFDEAIATATTRAEALGLPFKALIAAKTLSLHQVDPAEVSPGQFATEVRNVVERDGARIIVIDSLTGYLNAMPEEQFLLNQLHELLAYLGQQGVVTIMVATQHGLIGTMQTPVDVSYLADGVVLLRYFETRGSVRNAISVVKKRTGSHEKTLREYKVRAGGIEIGEPLREFQGVLSGIPAFVAPLPPLAGGTDGTAG